MIELKNVAISKSGRKLFENFSFHIEAGEHWVIQGGNGAGKTTLLQVLAGLIPPLSGHVHYSFIEGNDWDTLYQQRQEKIHFIPTHWIQSFLSGFDGLFYQQRYYTMDDTDIPTVRDVFGEDAVKLRGMLFSTNFNIENLLHLHVTRLSNGQLKKVIILRQLVKNIPKVLILDYPFDGLDADSRRDLGFFLSDIARQFGIQIILADHSESLPDVINRRLTLAQFTIEKEEVVRSGKAPATLPVPSPATLSDNGEAIVEMRDLTIEYGGKKILSNVNWRINRGERWALTGRNGSGKTTLFSLIYADHPMAYSQKVFLFGKRRGSGESIWDIKKRINYFGPEQIHFLNAGAIGFTAREHIEMQSRKKPGLLDDLVSFFKASQYIDLPVKHLSSGQLQMILLMNMFMDDKELLLLDEPFQFLDPENHELVTRYLSEYLNENITLILITHDERDVAKWTQLRKVL